jgi:hypothetical protein
MPSRRTVQRFKRGANNDVDVHSDDRRDYCDGGKPSDMAAQQKLELLSHQRSQRDSGNHSDSSVCPPALRRLQQNSRQVVDCEYGAQKE